MLKNSYAERLRRFIVDELLSREAEISPDDPMLADGILDSVGVMRLVVFIDEEFDYQVPPQHLTIDRFKTTRALAAYLERQLHGDGEG
jgi:acyl carrier protein